MKNRWPNYTLNIAEDLLNSDKNTTYLSVIMNDKTNSTADKKIIEKRFKVTERDNQYFFVGLKKSFDTEPLIAKINLNNLKITQNKKTLNLENFYEICFFQWLSEFLQNLAPQTKILTDLYRLNFFTFYVQIPLIFFPFEKQIVQEKIIVKEFQSYQVRCKNVIAFKNFFETLDFKVDVSPDDITFKFSNEILEKNNLGYFKSIPFSYSVINSSIFNDNCKIYLKAIMKHILFNLKEIEYNLSKFD